MSRYTQDSRLFSISDFSLGKDTFLITHFKGEEFISGLFEYTIEMLSENLDVHADSIMGQECTVSLQNKNPRFFHGYVSAFSYGEIEHHNLRTYRLTVVPWLWFLSKTNDYRIFQNKSTKQIVTEIFKEYGFTDFQFLAKEGSKREYCVQYDESDLNFVSRLLEEEGIAYFFKHEKNKHVLMIVDQNNAYEKFPETNLVYSKGSAQGSEITSWEHLYNFKKGQWSYGDYNFQEPTKKLFANVKTISKFNENKKFEHYQYPGTHDFNQGADLVKIRLEAQESGIDTIKAQSTCSTFYAGGSFTVAKHENANQKGDYTVVGIRHDISDTSYYTGQEDFPRYENSFVCMPSDVSFRPQISHSKPKMVGPHSALVTGPGGEEIYIDKLGRIKVQFYWDRLGQNNEKTTCFIRVMQAWAGNKWGASFIPRIGHEVIVSFMDGDPDRPIVTGTVYNGKNAPPYSSKTQSGIKSRSTQGGSASNFNEMRFDDKKGSEQLYMQAEKNQDNLVKNNETTNVGNDRTETIGNNETITIGANRKEDVGVNEDINIGSNRTENVGSNETITIGSDRTENVGSNETITIGANRTEDVGSNEKITIGSSRKESVGSNETVTIGKLRTHNVGINDMLNVGAAQEVSVGGFRMLNVGLYQNRNTGLNLLEKVGKKITIDVGDEILIKTGDASLNMKSDGTIILAGKDIQVKGSGDILIRAAKNLIHKAKKILEN